MLVKNGTKRFSVDSDSNTAGEDGRDSLESENSTIDQENVAPQELKRLKKSTCCSCFADDTPSFMEDYGNESVPQTAKLLKDLKNGHYQVLYKNKALKTVSYHRINFVPRKDVAKEIFGAIIQRKYSDESIVSDTRNTILQNPSTERSFSLFAIIQQINKYYNASRRLLWFNLSVGDPRTTNIIVLLVLLVGSFIVFYASMAFPLLVTHGFSNLGSYCVDLNANEFNLFGTIFSLSGASGIFSFYYNYFVAGDEDDDDDDKKAKKKSNGVELIEETKETEPLKGMTDKEKLRFARKKGLIVQYCKECQVPVRIRKRNTVVFICKNDHVNECLMSGSDLDIV